MKRHRDQHIRRHWLQLHVLSQQLPQGSRQRLEVTVLEMVNRFAYQAFEGKRGTDAIDIQLPVPAIRAAICSSQGFAACRAYRRGQSGQIALTRRTDKSTLASATNASGWEKQIDEIALDLVQSGYEHASSIDQDRLAHPGVMHRAADNRLVNVDVTVPYLEVEAAIGVSADPCFIVNWRALTAKVRQRHQIACIALLALGQTELLHKTTSHE
jgi:hypothetical protein